ncbi:ATP-grasp domain-containing protein [bacterium]|nr:MAG: ATP-grasp domain-containing protein [bacterium]
MKKIERLLVANRGVSAVRVMHTCRDRNIPTTAVYSTPDRLGHHVVMADKAVNIGEAPPVESYLNMENILQAAFQTGSDAIHPGWGFLAENADFAREIQDAGLIWVGPPPELISKLGDKAQARRMAIEAGVPVIPGTEEVNNVQDALTWLDDSGVDYPIMIKAASGGGGRGLVRVDRAEDLEQALSQAGSEAEKAFGSGTLILEKFIRNARHIEVQVLADRSGNTIHLYERECTIQRRNQKVIEEAPSPSLDDNLRREICDQAIALVKSIGYYSVGTVEFIFDSDTGKYYFLEVNTRLQVEHGLTELTTGYDLVGLMIDVAEGKSLDINQDDVHPNRWAIEVRLNAEDPETFGPSFGTITRLRTPDGPNLRVATGVYQGASVPPYYDSLLMLIMSTGHNRQDALKVMDRALGRSLRVEGVKTLKPLLISIIRHPAFREGDFSTRFIDKNIQDLVKTFREPTAEDEILKIAKYLAEVSALGPRSWV